MSEENRDDQGGRGKGSRDNSPGQQSGKRRDGDSSGRGEGQGRQGQQGRRGRQAGQGSPARGGARRPAREQLAEKRASQQRADRRRRSAGIAIAVVVVLVAIGIIGYAWWASNNDGPDNAALPALVDESGGGVVVGDGPVDVTVWEDFQCPFCKSFEQTNGDMLRQRVDNGDITLTIHPLSFLDAKLGNDSSSQAANAFGCVADAGEKQALDYHLTLYANQPTENPGTPAWTTEQLIGWGNDVGVEGSTFEDCVNNLTYQGWVTQVQSTMGDEGITATPTVFVDGQEFDVQKGDLQATIDKALQSDQ
ncbi:MAG: DsbA family protein [Actinomycetes bacterium]